MSVWIPFEDKLIEKSWFPPEKLVSARGIASLHIKLMSSMLLVPGRIKINVQHNY